jgi:hypothetical protein
VYDRTVYDIRVSDARELFHKWADYGHHPVVAYGNYAVKVGKLAELIGMEPEFVL